MRSILSVSLSAWVGLAVSTVTAAHAVEAPVVPAETLVLTSNVGEPPAGGRRGVIRPLPAAPESLVLRGEYDRLTLPIYLTPSEAGTVQAFGLTLADRSVSALPQAATLTVLINGRAIAILNGEDLVVGQPMRLPMPAGLAVAGFNAVTVVAEGRHRVDCSITGTFELWTRLDAVQTGFVSEVAASTTTDPLAHLPALLESAGAPGHVRLVVPAGEERLLLDATVRAVQSLMLAGWSWSPRVDILTAPTGDPGLEVRRASVAEAAALVAEGGRQLVPGIVVRTSTTMARRVEVLVVGDTPEAIDAAARALQGSMRAPVGSVDGLAALADEVGRPLDGGANVSLGDLGFESATVSGRRFTDSVRLTLPPDAYLAGYGAAILRLDGGYAGGLDTDSTFTVHVNGREAATIDLAARDGGVFEDHEVKLPLTVFHPGDNTLTFESRTSTPADRICDPTAADQSPRFALMDTTRLEIPALAHTGALPELGGVVGYGFPHSTPGRPMVIYVLNQDATTLGIGLTMAMRATVALGIAVPLDLRFSQPRPTDPGGLVVAPRSALPSFLAHHADPSFVTGGSGPADLRSGNRVSLAPAVSEPASSPVADNPFKTTTGRFAVPEEAVAETPSSIFSPRLVEAFRPAAESVERFDFKSLVAIDWRPVADRWLDRAAGRRSAPPMAPLASGDLILAQSAVLPPDAPAWTAFAEGVQPVVWTVISAEDTPSMEAGFNRLATKDDWNAIGGARTVLRADGDTIETRPAVKPVLFGTRPLDLGNARLTLAGWLTDEAGLYTLIVLGLGVLLGFIGAALSRPRVER
ncbi:cellulose biosynthesis cyclic di-GMP-binding regulatory protein BcsB [Mongoliimonas terrestris]|uniref:cellulose biosynthesis cyclic di-GMP-binding regulatory protein BcsB n=1 Tax=Mongoliimonas terrestris TaxID=1709001 RepID=UPI0009498608|nr:cellulose biosynthesis cyclic di-GMP-binding regulatory protein BcsB [Mongoliimonas terrestris]